MYIFEKFFQMHIWNHCGPMHLSINVWIWSGKNSEYWYPLMCVHIHWSYFWLFVHNTFLCTKSETLTKRIIKIDSSKLSNYTSLHSGEFRSSKSVNFSLHNYKLYNWKASGITWFQLRNKIRDLFKVKLYTIRSETEQREKGRN